MPIFDACDALNGTLTCMTDFLLLYSTPLTHQRFLNRYRGSYGPAIRAGEASFPFPGTPVKGLLSCGDSCFPGIGGMFCMLVNVEVEKGK